LRAAVLAAAREHAALLARTYETRSDATGSYRFERLPEGGYRVGAYAEGYVVEVFDGGRNYAETDARLDFLARPVVRLPLRLTLPEGGPPAKAVVLAMPLDERDPSATSYTWSLQDSELRLTPGRYEINALGERVALSAGEPPSSLRSETKTVELAAGTAPAELVLVLRERLGIRGRVIFPKDGLTGLLAWVRLLPLAPGAELDLALLADARTTSFVRGDDDYAFLDLEPGRYAVGVTCGASELRAHAVVEVLEGLLDQDFELPPVDRSLYLSVRVFDPQGAPVAEPDFRFVHEWEGGNDTLGTHSLRGPDGQHLLAIPARYLDDYRAGTAGLTFALSVAARGRGAKAVELVPGQSELTVHLAAPARLALDVPGGTAAPMAGRLSVELRRTDVAAGRRAASADVGMDGACTLEGLAPGDYLLTMRISDRRGPNTSELILLAAEELRLVSGENRASVSVPALYPVSVQSLAQHAGANAFIAPAEAGRGLRRWIGADNHELDAEGRARFEYVPAGRYTVRILVGSEELARRDIEVPCGEVQLGD